MKVTVKKFEFDFEDNEARFECEVILNCVEKCQIICDYLRMKASAYAYTSYEAADAANDLVQEYDPENLPPAAYADWETAWYDARWMSVFLQADRILTALGNSRDLCELYDTINVILRTLHF